MRRLLCEALCGALGSKDVVEKALQWELIRTDSRKWGGRTRRGEPGLRRRSARFPTESEQFGL